MLLQTKNPRWVPGKERDQKSVIVNQQRKAEMGDSGLITQPRKCWSHSRTGWGLIKFHPARQGAENLWVLTIKLFESMSMMEQMKEPGLAVWTGWLIRITRARHNFNSRPGLANQRPQPFVSPLCINCANLDNEVICGQNDQTRGSRGQTRPGPGWLRPGTEQLRGRRPGVAGQLYPA